MPTQVVFDTCALLDLVRAPLGEVFDPGYSEGVQRFLAAAQFTQPTISFFVPGVVRAEYDRNLQTVADDTRRRLVRMRDQYRRSLDIIGPLGEAPLAVVDNAYIDVAVNNACNLAQSFLDLATIEPATAEDHNRAWGRVLAREAPAKSGKNSPADCLVAEIALRLARTKEAAGITRSLFFSSNTRDFCNDRNRLEQSLSEQFAAAGLEYVRNWGEACEAALPSVAAE